MEAAMALDVTDREGALEQMVDAYGDGVLQLAYLYLRDRALAEDLFQDVFTRVYTHMDQFRGESSPRTWIYRIAINLCRDRLRAWSMRKVLLLGEELLYGRAGPDPATTEDAVLERADKAALLDGVMRLPIEYREVVLLYYYEEMDCREVAATLRLTEGTVRSRLHRARAKLKAILVEGGFVDGGQ